MPSWGRYLEYPQYVEELRQLAEQPLRHSEAVVASTPERRLAGIHNMAAQLAKTADVEQRYILGFRLVAMAAALQRDPFWGKLSEEQRRAVMQIAKRWATELERLSGGGLRQAYDQAMHSFVLAVDEAEATRRAREAELQREKELEQKRKEEEAAQQQREAERRVQEQKIREEREAQWRALDALKREEAQRQLEQQQQQQLQHQLLQRQQPQYPTTTRLPQPSAVSAADVAREPAETEQQRRQDLQRLRWSFSTG
eukprot:RCo012732